MKRFIIIVLCLAVSRLSVWAQEPVHEFSVFTGLGLSSLRYQLSQGDRSGGFGGDFGVCYTYFRSDVRVTGTGRVFHEQWGILAGLGLGFYNAKSTMGNNEEIVIEGLRDNDIVPDRFNLHSTLTGYKESQKTTYLNIPVMAQFQLDRYYALTGFKFGIPVGGKFKSKDATIINKAYYPDYENELTGPNSQGLGTFAHKSDGKIKFGVTLMWTFEGGLNWRLTKNFSLYSGVYFDVGLNNAAKNLQKQFVEFDYNAAGNRFSTNSMMSSFTERVNIMAVGVKLRLAYVR